MKFKPIQITMIHYKKPKIRKRYRVGVCNDFSGWFYKEKRFKNKKSALRSFNILSKRLKPDEYICLYQDNWVIERFNNF